MRIFSSRPTHMLGMNPPQLPAILMRRLSHSSDPLPNQFLEEVVDGTGSQPLHHQLRTLAHLLDAQPFEELLLLAT